MSDSNLQPPKWADRCLGWYCSPEVREQVQGDAHELYYWRLEGRGKRIADRAFIWDVVRLFRWANIKRTTGQNRKINNIAMFKNYFKIGLRNLWKQKMSSTINVIGLSMAIGCCLVAFKFIELNLVKDNFHKNGGNIYLTTHTAFVNGDLGRYGFLSVGISELMKADFPAIDNITRYSRRSTTVTLGDRVFSSTACFVDEHFFNTFSFPLKYGDKDLLKEPKNIAISTPTAIRYFGDEYPIGKTVSMKFNGESHDFIVAGVLEDIPQNSSIRPNVLVNFELAKKGKDLETMRSHVFVQTVLGTDVAGLAASLNELTKVQRGYQLDRKYDELGLQPLTTMAKNSGEVIDGLGSHVPMAPMILIASIGLFMLILSIFNYINIATLMATKRIKEIGVRKVIGGRRGQLIVQFLTENLIVCSISIIIGCLLAAGFFLPQFNIISGNNMALDLLHHRNLWIFLVTILFLITIVSGAYPAFFVSSFKAVTIFRGAEKLGGKRRFTSVLLSFQFTLAIITIVAGIMAVNTNWINQQKDWGFNQMNKLVIEVPPEHFGPFFEEARKNPAVMDLAGSIGSMGQYYDYKAFQIGDREIYGGVLQGDMHYPELLEMPIVTGRYFDEKLISDFTSSVLVNETFMKSFGLDLSKDHLVQIDSINYQIIGVLQDFHYSSISAPIDPAVVFALPDSMMTHITLATNEASLLAVRDEMNVLWDRLGIKSSFESQLQTDAFQSDFEDMKGLRNVLLFVASLAILLSSMGLFGLVSLSISSKIKVFGIKKILGASRSNLANDVYKGFALILGIGILLGSAIAVKLVTLLLDSAYGEHEPIGIVPLSVSAIILLTVAVLTIHTQLLKVQRMNPAETLRVE